MEITYNQLIPEVNVSDIDKSIAFYTKYLGFKIEYRRIEDKFVFLSLQKAQLMIEQENDFWETGKRDHPYGRGINFQINVNSITPITNTLHKYNYPLFREPKDSWYKVGKLLIGKREFLVQDPDGYLLRFAEFLGEQPN